MKIYISGPISASCRADRNRSAFDRASVLLEALGHKPLSPFNNSVPSSGSWLDHMRADIRMLSYADGVARLPGWEQSPGATVECGLAESLGLPVHDLATWVLDPELIAGTPELVEADPGDAA